MSLIRAQGAKVYVSTVLPTAFTKLAYEALTWEEGTHVVSTSTPQVENALVDQPTLTYGHEKDGGDVTIPDVTVTFIKGKSDVTKTLQELSEARVNNPNASLTIATKFELSDGEVRYATAAVLSAKQNELTEAGTAALIECVLSFNTNSLFVDRPTPTP